MISKTDISIRNYHIDNFGHVNHGRYVELLEEARWRYLEENNLLAAIHRVKAFHVVSQLTIQYLRPARIGDIIRFDIRIQDRSDYYFRVSQKGIFKSTGKPVVDATVTNVFVDDRGKPRPIDDEILGIWPDLAEAVRDSHRG